MEILSPAGSREALERACAAGADAVYLGYAAFSARAGAGNFDEDQLREALSFAHLHHMRVYVTVNTLIKDAELAEVYQLLRTLNELRADGILVQDLGVLRMARRCFPGLRVHVSTQMAIHHETGVRWCAEMGMTRVVLARECSLEEIRRCGETGVEIEVFGHGAQCVSVSGECLFSSMVGNRSGNRGRCAQPCRKLYKLDGRTGAWLSPRDLCLRDRIPELAEAGAASLKIEGRLKRPEYVYTVTESYRRGMDSQQRGAFRMAEEPERESLRQAFHRGGFMEGYAFHAEDAGVIYPEGVNHQGIRVGEVARGQEGFAQVRLERELHDGDGLRIGHPGRSFEMTYAGKDVPAGETARIRLRPGLRAEKGDEVWRLTDARQNAAAMAAAVPLIPVEMELKARPGEEISLRLSDGESEVTINGEPVEAARNRETTAEEMARQLKKTGGTDFEVREIRVETAGAFVPVSMLNELRREGLERLAEARRERFAYPVGPVYPMELMDNMPLSGEPGTAGTSEQTEDEQGRRVVPELSNWETGKAETPERMDDKQKRRAASELPNRETAKAGTLEPTDDEQRRRGTTDRPHELVVTVRTPEQAAATRGQDVLLCWYPEDFRPEAMQKLAEEMRPGDWLRLPEVCEEDTLQALRAFVEEYQEKLGGVLLGSVGQLGIAWPVPIAAGPGIPVMNREAARLLREQGCAFVTASPELTGEETQRLMEPGEGLPPIVFPAYGRTQLMLLHHCPARTVQGWKSGHAACQLCDLGDPRALRGKALEDERGYRFPLQRVRLPEGCLIRLLNDLPTDLGDRRISGPRMAEMTTESAQEAADILSRLREFRRTEGKTTRGHWNRPVL